MKDIAEKAGVSRQAVSKVLNKTDSWVGEETRERILRIAEELKYRPNRFARTLKTGKTNTVCITTMMGDIGQYAAPYESLIYRGINRIFRDTDYQLSFNSYRGDRGDGNLEELAGQKQYDGAILLLFSGNVASLRKHGASMFTDLPIPCIRISSVKKPLGVHNVGTDCEQAGRLAAEHLVEHGYRSVGFIGTEQYSEHIDDLKQGYQAALKKAGMPVKPEHLFTARNYEFQDGYAWAEAMLEKKVRLPRALVVFEEAFCFGAMRKFQEAGVSVPDDIAVIAFGNIRDEALGLAGLTCVSQPAAAKGAHAADLLLKSLNNEADLTEPRNDIIPSQLVIRSSCGCSKKHARVS